MKKLLLFAAVAGLGLVSASPPAKGPDNGEREARRHYPPCSRTVTDRCIQLYERGRAREEHAGQRGHREHYAGRDDGEHRGHGEHYAGRDDGDHHARGDHHAPGDHHARGDHRGCRDHARGDHRPAHRVVRTARVTRVAGCRCNHPPRRQYAQRVRRAGERG